MTDIITIPLNRLTPWKGNVRRTGAKDGIEELAASLAAHGQLQSILVREGKRGRYEILAGRRRYFAFMELAKDGHIGKDHPVSCTLAASEVDATELSLVENTIRAPMHPADQFEAFRDLVDRGASVTDVAARFGVADSLVMKRLKLGRLSPVILDAYRKDEIDLEQAQAFAISDDHQAQERVLAELPAWNCNPGAIRRALTEGEVRATDKRVRFIGLDAYEAAGGTIRRDLFGDNSDAFVLDGELLDRLVAEKLASAAAGISAEGWRWTKAVVDLDHRALSRFTRRYPESVPLSDAHQNELDRLNGEYDRLAEIDDSADAERLGVIAERIEDLYALGRKWTGSVLSAAGAIVSLDHDGSVSVERGLVRPEDLPAEGEQAQAPSDDDDRSALPKGLSPRLIEDLTAHKTAAIGAELLGRPDIALAAVVHCLALVSLYEYARTDSCLEMSCHGFPHSALTDAQACSGLSALKRECDLLHHRLPGNPDDLWPWCLARSRDELLEVLALIAARSVNAVQRKEDRPDAPRLAHAMRLAQALNLDMTAWFTPSAESYFSRISRAQILEAIDAAKGSHAPSLEKLKKNELAARAEALVAGTGWLPEPLRAAAASEAVE